MFPVFYYNRTLIFDAAVVGGHVYRGCMNPDFNGWYIFADYGNELVLAIKFLSSLQCINYTRLWRMIS